MRRYNVMFREGIADPPGLARRLLAPHRVRPRRIFQHAIRGFSADLPDAALLALLRHPQIVHVVPVATFHVGEIASWGLDRVDQRELPLDGSYLAVQRGTWETKVPHKERFLIQLTSPDGEVASNAVEVGL